MKVLCVRCREKIGHLPGLLPALGRGRPLDEVRQKHFNCPKKESSNVPSAVRSLRLPPRLLSLAEVQPAHLFGRRKPSVRPQAFQALLEATSQAPQEGGIHQHPAPAPPQADPGEPGTLAAPCAPRDAAVSHSGPYRWDLGPESKPKRRKPVGEPYNPQKAKQIAKKTLTEEQTPKEQIAALVALPKEDFRQVLMGVLRGDI